MVDRMRAMRRPGESYCPSHLAARRTGNKRPTISRKTIPACAMLRATETGKCTRPVLVLHERKSRVTLAARLTGKTAAETISAMLAVFGRIDPHLRRSITFDNDTAFAQHGLLRTMRDMTTWFCDAYGLKPEAFAGREVGRQDDLLDVLVGCAVDIEVAPPST